MIFTKYASVVVKLPFKLVVLFITALLASLGGYGLSLLQTEFKFEWFIDEGTYLRDFFEVTSERFPSGGISGEIWVAEVPDIHQKYNELNELIKA